jgi:hypothetical protein
MIFYDLADVAGVRETRNGFLVANARCARGGNIQDYAGHEVGRPDLAMVRVYREPEEVFKRDSLNSYPHKPICLSHPATSVTPETWKDAAVGYIGEEVVRDGEFVRIPMLIADAAAIAAVKGGTKQLSVGYECELVFEDGVTPDGQKYQAKQRNIIVDHVAIVERGRAGSECRIGDRRSDNHDKENDTMSTLRKVVIDGLTIEVTDQGAEAIAKLQKQVSDGAASVTAAQQALADAKTAHATALADKDKEITDLKAKLPTVDQLEAMFEKRAAVIDVAKKLVPDFDPKGKSLADVRKAVVAKKLGDDAVKDKEDAAIAPMFDTLALLTKDGAADADPVRDAMRSGATSSVNDAEKARAKCLAGQANAWAA